MRTLRFHSIRERFLAVVLCGAVLPLALAGLWLARSSVHSAEALLRAQLDTSLTTIAANMEQRWSFRRGDLLMLAGNDVVLRTMMSRGASMSTADSAFVDRLFANVSATIPRVLYRATDGTVRWRHSAAAASEVASDSARRGRSSVPWREARVPVAIPVRRDGGPLLGTLEAEVRLTAILPADSIPILLNGAQLTVADRRSGQAYAFDGSGNAPGNSDLYTVAGERWIAQHRTIASSLLVVTAAAPTRAYVAPFEHSAGIGGVVLIVVTLLSFGLSVYFTDRITRSLVRLAGAADTVASGHLERNVETNGDDEVGRLARSFNTMIDSLRRTLRELSHREALAAVGEFASSLSHEVRNGLTAVRVDLERVEESASTTSETGALVTRALRNVHRLNGTVSGALAVARSGRAELQDVDLRTVLQAAAAAAESAFATTGSRLSVHLDHASTCRVRGDAVALEQLFLNLLLNAAQAMSHDGTAQLELTIEDHACQVTLRDSGPGMSMEALARIAEPFVSSKRGGTGLGLSITRRIAEAHGGALTFDNVPGSGLLARVRLPCVHR